MRFAKWRTRMRTVHWLNRYEKWGLDPEYAIGLMKATLRDTSRCVRQDAVGSLIFLSRRGEKSYIADVVPLLADPSRRVRHCFARRLYRFPREISLRLLLEAVAKEENPSTIRRLRRLIGAILKVQDLDI